MDNNKSSYIYLITLFIVVVICLFFGLKSCSHTTTDNVAVNSENSPFVSISSDIVYGKSIEEKNNDENIYEDEEYTIFAYDKNTKIVYYLFSNYKRSITTEGGHTYTYFAEYINENGKHCKYDEKTKKVVEID